MVRTKMMTAAAEDTALPGADADRLRVAIVVCFLDEEALLPTFLASLAAQTVPPEQVLLVDDGSRDDSFALAAAFAAEHPWARALRRPQRPQEGDRLVSAAELRAFQWGVEQLAEPWDVVCKMDADLDLTATLVARAREALAADPGLGMVGSYLRARHPDGVLRREPHPEVHVRGPNEFFRRACFEQISPLPAILGWDTIDELRARRRGWRTRSLELPEGDVVHLRPTGMHGGRLRMWRRHGRCAYGAGTHPLAILVGGLSRARMRPYGLSGLAYVWGWAWAALRRVPRADADTRRHARTEDVARLRAAFRRSAARVDPRG
ncbi:glycosyltransferase family A protein [Patulibacter sp. NPDC049589]|uniref:glycosyltransferase family 2 protein n=1 Tax=Patulibacter sp. NPDC049589 TaxID=3154731 RepID=UPI003441ACA1